MSIITKLLFFRGKLYSYLLKILKVLSHINTSLNNYSQAVKFPTYF